MEQAKTTENVPTGAIQSLTTSKNKEAGRGFVVATAQTSIATERKKSNVPYNIKNNSNIVTNDENVVVEEFTTKIIPRVTLVHPTTEKTNTYIAPIDTTPSRTITTRKTTISTSATTIATTISTTPTPTKTANSIRRGTTTNRPIASTNLSTPSQDQSTLQRNLLLLQELLGLTENGARGLNQVNPIKPTTVSMRRFTTASTSTTSTSTSTTTTSTTTTTPKPSTTSTVSPTVRAVQFNSIDDILNSLQTSKPTTQRPRTTTSAEVDDLTFINRLVTTYNVYETQILIMFFLSDTAFPFESFFDNSKASHQGYNNNNNYDHHHSKAYNTNQLVAIKHQRFIC